MTMHTGEELGVDLENLWSLATADLPEIARRWAKANAELHRHGADRGVFERQAPLGVVAGGHQLVTTSVGRVYPHFDQLRDELQTIMAESATNAYDAADALIQIINNYASTDQAIKDRFERLIADHTRDSVPQRPVTHKPQ